MATISEQGFALKNSDGLYYNGMHQATKKLREARIYKSEKYANEAIDFCKNATNAGLAKIKRDFKLVPVEIRELPET